MGIKGGTPGKKTLQCKNLFGRGLAGKILSQKDLSGIWLMNPHFDGTYLIKTNLANAKLNGAKFSHATMNGVNMENVMMKNAKIYHTDMSSIPTRYGRSSRPQHFIESLGTQSNLKNVTLEKVNCTGADFTNATIKLKDYDFPNNPKRLDTLLTPLPKKFTLLH